MSDKIAISDLKAIANKYGLDHVIFFATKGKQQYVATYGHTVEACDQAAQYGDKMKDALGWPESLHAMPSRVKALLNRALSADRENERLTNFLKQTMDVAYSIYNVCTYQTEATAAAGKYELPRDVWMTLDKLIQEANDLSDHIVKTSSDNNKPSNSAVTTKQDILTTIKTEGNFVVCQKCRSIVPPQMMRYQMYYCPNCGRKITAKGGEK